MKQIITLLLVCAALSGCHTARQAPVAVEHATHDTLYINRLQYDSIYIDRWHTIENRVDTVVVSEREVQYKYRLLRDTIRLSECDTIPIVYEVEVAKREPYIPWYAKTLAWIGVIAIIIAIAKITKICS